MGPGQPVAPGGREAGCMAMVVPVGPAGPRPWRGASVAAAEPAVMPGCSVSAEPAGAVELGHSAQTESIPASPHQPRLRLTATTAAPMPEVGPAPMARSPGKLGEAAAPAAPTAPPRVLMVVVAGVQVERAVPGHPAAPAAPAAPATPAPVLVLVAEGAGESAVAAVAAVPPLPAIPVAA